jgi:hypothetical protein
MHISNFRKILTLFIFFYCVHSEAELITRFQSLSSSSSWNASSQVIVGQKINFNGNLFVVVASGTTGTSGPDDTSGNSFMNGSATLAFKGKVVNSNSAAKASPLKFVSGPAQFIFNSHPHSGFCMTLNGDTDVSASSIISISGGTPPYTLIDSTNTPWPIGESTTLFGYKNNVSFSESQNQFTVTLTLPFGWGYNNGQQSDNPLTVRDSKGQTAQSNYHLEIHC